MFVVVILIFAHCLCGPALSNIIEAQQLSHGRSNRQAPNSNDTQTQNAEMNIAFDLPDITAAFELPSGSVQLEGFKHVNNDKLMAEKKTSQLSWVSIGHPHFIKTEDQQNPGDMKFFHSSNRGFTTYVQMMTEKQKTTLATAARNKYQVDIADPQVKHMVLAKFDCNILLYDEADNKYLVSGKISDFRQFPLRMDFDIPPGQIERILFTNLIKESGDDLRFECHIESSGGKLTRTNTLSISYEQSQQIGLEEKLFGPAGSNGPNEVYVARNQMTELAHEMYSTLNIIEEYQMPETQFSEAFVNDFISQLASSQFNQVPIDTVLASISKYSFDFGADLRPDIIKKDIGSFLSVNKTDEKSRIIFDEKRYNEWADSYKFSYGGSASVPGLFSASINAALDISRSGATNNQKLDDQMRELNTLAQKEAKWEIEGEKIVPKSLNVARIMRANMKKSLTFKRIRLQQFHAPFERNFKLYTSRASQLLCQNISTTKERYEEMLESMFHNVLYLKNASRDFRFQSQKIDSIKMDLMIQSEQINSIRRDSSIQSQKLGSIQNKLPGKVCPYGFDYVLEIDQCLRLFSQLKTWSNSRDACNSIMPGVKMAAITNSVKQAAVRRYLEIRFSSSETNVCTLSAYFGKVAWISGQTKDPNRCGTPFVWKPSPGEEIPFIYTSWLSGEPNCKQGVERCTNVWTTINYVWNDAECSIPSCFLCEF